MPKTIAVLVHHRKAVARVEEHLTMAIVRVTMPV
jgi:hypothetical protein